MHDFDDLVPPEGELGLRSRSALPADADLASMYLRSTNSRRWAATLMIDLIEDVQARRVVDVGAGDGALASAIAAHVPYVAAVEPDHQRACALLLASDLHETLEYLPARVEDVDLPSGSFDLGLLSYVLETLPPTSRDSLLMAASDLLRPDGRLVGVSFVEGCDWDQYVETSKNACGGSRYVGFGELAKSLRTHGWFVHRELEFPTRITARTLGCLFEICGHFMGRRITEYLRRRDELEPTLRRLANVSSSGLVSLDILECTYTVSRTP